VVNLIAGTYEFQLKVTDNEGAEASDTVTVTIALGRIAFDNNTGLKVYPNPVNSITTVQFTAKQINTNNKIIITDLLGRSVYQKQFVAASKDVSLQIDMSNLIKGPYTISVYSDGMERQSLKVIKL